MYCVHGQTSFSSDFSNYVKFLYFGQDNIWQTFWVDLCGSTLRLYKVKFTCKLWFMFFTDWFLFIINVPITFFKRIYLYHKILPINRHLQVSVCPLMRLLYNCCLNFYAWFFLHLSFILCFLTGIVLVK